MSITNARTVWRRPFDRLLAESARSRPARGAPSHVASLSTMRPGRPREVLQPLREVHGVTDERVLDPLLGAEQRRRDRPGRHADAETEPGELLALPSAR